MNHNFWRNAVGINRYSVKLATTTNTAMKRTLTILTETDWFASVLRKFPTRNRDQLKLVHDLYEDTTEFDVDIYQPRQFNLAIKFHIFISFAAYRNLWSHFTRAQMIPVCGTQSSKATVDIFICTAIRYTKARKVFANGAHGSWTHCLCVKSSKNTHNIQPKKYQ